MQQDLIPDGNASQDLGSSNRAFGQIFAHTKVTGSAISTGSFGHGIIAGNLEVGGKVTAQEFHTEFVSSSIVFQSGSTKFGDTADDTHIFSGSVTIKSPSGDALILDDNNNASNDIAWAYNGSKQYYIQMVNCTYHLMVQVVL
jgi:hypothetical protein